MRRGRLVGEKVIGRGERRFASRIAGMGALVGSIRRARGACRVVRFLASSGMLALLHQLARQHGRGILLKPRIEQLRDLLAKIGGMAEPRKFITLQGIARSREQELPGRLGLVCSKGASRETARIAMHK